MKKSTVYFLLILLGVYIPGSFCSAKIETDTDKDGLSNREETSIYKTDSNNSDTDGDGFSDLTEVTNGFSPTGATDNKLQSLVLSVPYTSEAPDGVWTGPWKNACEESTIAMVEKYYLGQQTMTKTQAKTFMQMLFDKQNKLYGSNADSDSVRNTYLINNHSSYVAIVKDNPTVEEIINELNNRRPVISMHYGFDLKNKNIPFLSTGSAYHVMTIIGYNNTTQEFIVNDPGDTKAGKQHRYGYELFISSLHDFNFKLKKANGPARVLFTYPKLVKTPNSSRVYYINGKEYQYITSPAAFKNRGWNWNAINIVTKDWLQSFSPGAEIVK